MNTKEGRVAVGETGSGRWKRGSFEIRSFGIGSLALGRSLRTLLDDPGLLLVPLPPSRVSISYSALLRAY